MSCHGGRSASARAEAEVACEDGMLEGIAVRIGRHDPAAQRVTPRGGVGESLRLSSAVSVDRTRWCRSVASDHCWLVSGLKPQLTTATILSLCADRRVV